MTGYRSRATENYFWINKLCLLGPLFCFCAPSILWAAELIKIDSHRPLNIRADEIIFDENANSYLAIGEVEIISDTNRIFADRVHLNPKNLIVDAEGRVEVTTPTEVLTGERILVDLRTGIGKIYNGLIFIRPTYYYFRGEEIEKINQDTYRIRCGGFTTCDGNNPTWEIIGHNIEISIEGYGHIYDTSFRLHNLPIFWSPYAAFPAKFKRQPGLLPLIAGYSDRNGLFLSQPWYQTLGDTQDLTLTLNYMSKRGIDTNLEYRYALTRFNKGIISMDFLSNDAMAQELKYSLKNDDIWNTRYWIRSKVNQLFFNNTSLKIDLDLVSDRDYLNDFTYGYTGYEKSNNYFGLWFNRDLDPSTSTVRENKIIIHRHWTTSIFNASAFYYDDLISNNKETLHPLPSISYDTVSQPIREFGLYFQIDSVYTNYYREKNSHGHILDVVPSLFLPFNFSNYLELQTNIICKEKIYSVTQDWSDIANLKLNGLNTLWSFSTTVSSYLYRNFDFKLDENLIKIKHAVQPNISYMYTPNINQNNIPLLAFYDQSRIKLISYGLDNTLTSKINQHNKNNEIKSIYCEFLKFAFFHSFDVEQAQIKNKAIEPYPWGTLDSRIQFLASNFLLLQSETSWNPYSNHWESIGCLLRIKDWRGDSVTIDYQFVEDILQQLTTKIKIAITKEWFIGWLTHKDLENNNDFQDIYELGYEGQCWAIRTFYQNDARQHGFFLAFSLGGFGEMITQTWRREAKATN